MSALPFLAPKKPRWALGFGIAALATLAAGVLARTMGTGDPGRGAGLVFGTLAAAIFVFEALYPMRRRLLSKPFRTAQTWLQLHVWGGLLAALLVLAHEAFRKPGGTMGWLLLLLTVWVTLSGILGVVLQKVLPALVSRGLSVEAVFERIPELVSRLPVEADALLAGASDVLAGFYQSEVRGALGTVTPSWAYLLDVQGGRDRRLEPFARITQFVPEEERPKLHDLQTIFVEKLELDAQYSVQRALRRWTLLHVPPAAVLLALVAIHIATALLY